MHEVQESKIVRRLHSGRVKEVITECESYCSHTTVPRGVLAWICQNPETYKPKFHCRRQSGMNFGYVTVNGVNSNV